MWTLFPVYWADAITIALKVYYKERTYSILYYIDKKWKKYSHITIIYRTRRERDEKEKNNDDS